MNWEKAWMKIKAELDRESKLRASAVIEMKMGRLCEERLRDILAENYPDKLDEARRLAEEWRDWGLANMDWTFCDWDPQPAKLPWERSGEGE